MQFRRFLSITAFALWTGLSASTLQGLVSVQEDTASSIAQAEDFYYEARFSDALKLLSSIDQKLSDESGRTSDQVRVKMLIGLCQLGLDDVDEARSWFLESCVLDPHYVPDEQRFPPKVVSMFKEMGDQCRECVAVCAAGGLQGDADLKSQEPSCPCPSTPPNGEDARLSYGRELLAQKKYPEALQEFQSLLLQTPGSEPLLEAVSAVREAINAALQTAVFEWRTQFSSREFGGAAATYELIRTLEAEASAEGKESARQVAAQYETTFRDLITSWNSACTRSDTVALNAIRLWGEGLDPNHTIQPDAINRMQCTAPPAREGPPNTTGNR